MKQNARMQVETETVHTQVEEMGQTEQEKNLERRAPPPHRAQRMRPCQKQPQLRFQRSLAAPSKVMMHPTRAKMQEQEDHKMETALAEDAEKKRYTEEWMNLNMLAPPPLLS